MLLQISSRKDLIKSKLEQIETICREQLTDYIFIIGIFYQHRDSAKLIFQQLFAQDICSEMAKEEKALYAYRSELAAHRNSLFLFCNTQYTDEDFNQMDRAIIDCSNVLIGLDYTSQDSYHSLEQHLNKVWRDKEVSLVSKKNIHYLYPPDQNLVDLQEVVRQKNSIIIQIFLGIQEEREITDSIVIKLCELEKYDLVPLPSNKLQSFISVTWESLLSQSQKGNHSQLKQIIVGCHFEELWELMVNVLEKRTNEYRKQCLSGEIHDINKQQKEFNSIADDWKQSSSFLISYLLLVKMEPSIGDQIKGAIQTQTFKIFNFQLNNIHNQLTNIFYQKLTELQNQEQASSSNQNNYQKLSSRGASLNTNQLSLPVRQVKQAEPQQILQGKNLQQSINPLEQSSAIIEESKEESLVGSSQQENILPDTSNQEQIIQEDSEESKVNQLIGENPIEIKSEEIHVQDLQNQTFGTYEGVFNPLEEADKSQEQEQESSFLVQKEEKEEEEEPLKQINLQQSNSSFLKVYTSQATSRISIKGTNSVEMSSKIPGRLSTPSLNLNNQGNSLRRGSSLLPPDQGEVKLYEIMKKTKLRVMSELKTKMIQMLNSNAKEQLGIDAEMDLIEEQINEIIIKALKKRAELEVNELVQQRILAILKADISKLFDQKDTDFWLKFKGIHNKIMAEWIQKIERFLKERFNFSQKHSNELLVDAQETIKEEVKSFVKMKMGDIISSFIKDLEENDKIKQGREDEQKIYQKYKEFVMEVRNGRQDDQDQDIILTDTEYASILTDLNHLLNVNKSKLKLRYHSLKIYFEKSVMKRRKTFFSLNPYLKWNSITLTLLLFLTVLWAKGSITLENSVGIVLFCHIAYTFIKS